MRIVRRLLAVTMTAGLLVSGGVLTATSAAAAYPTCNTIGIRNGIATPYASAAGTYTCNLRYLNTGAGVRALQDSLNECHGFNLVLDGSYGRATQAAVLKFQKDRGLEADAVYGPQTRNAIKWVFWSNGTPRPSCHSY
ncbi:Bacteriophage protein [Mycobacteroides abscessus]|nr:Bacteriophage protein [Mycobacteroides abscessus]